jgi:ArsR family transcriptional regulator, arsenate/arsenite/antimonite-responsive transcriptional repressor
MRLCAYTRCVTTTRRTAPDPEALLAAVAEPTRLRLLALIAGGETCVCDLVGALDLPQPLVSRHLGVLRRAGLVTARRDGLWMHYSLAEPCSRGHAKLLEALAVLHAEMAGVQGLVKRCSALRAGRNCC